MNVLTLELRLGSPKRSKWVNKDSVWLHNILSMLSMLSKRVFLASQYLGKWKKKWFIESMSPPKIQMGFIVSLKPCLNLCSLRWLKPRQNLVNSFIPFWLKISKILLGEGLINPKSLFVKILIFSEFLISQLSLFHSTIMKKEKRSF